MPSGWGVRVAFFSDLACRAGRIVQRRAVAWVSRSHASSAASTALSLAASGALASGLGYALWYAALPKLGALRGAFVQLVVPVLAAAAGIALLGERPSLRMWIATPALECSLGKAIVPQRDRGLRRRRATSR